jgi:hypothetical protein
MRAPVVMLVAVVAACGFAPEPDFSGRRNGDGIAPWEDLGPVQACIGNEFLGPPSSDPGGLCFASDVSETPCTRDESCASREACVCGRCIVPYCEVSSDCRGGRICTFNEHRCDRACASDLDCTEAEVCFNGACRGRCLGDADCQTGEVCNSQNRCVTDDCSDDSGCQGGERCRVQRVPRLVLEATGLASDTPDGPRVTLYVEMSSDANLDNRAIYRAVSEDGRFFLFEPVAPVLQDGGAAHAPSVLRTDAGVALYYEYGAGAEIRVVQSTDGISFGEPETVLTGGTGPAAIHAPSAVQLPTGNVAVYYEIGDGAAIDLAIGSLGAPLTAQGPVLTPDDVTDPPAGEGASFQRWDGIETVRSPQALVVEDEGGPALRLWFAAYGQESGDSFQFGEIMAIPPNYSIGYAAASVEQPGSLIVWDYNPVLDRVESFLDHRSELGPGMVQLSDEEGAPDNGYLLYYVDAPAGTSAGPFSFGRLGVAGNGVYPP